MSEAWAWIRLRGGSAIAAGVLLSVGVQIFQNQVLTPTGYVMAVNAIVAHQDFGPLLSWTAAHPAESRFYHVIEVIPFLLALGLPAPLRLLLWPDVTRAGRVALWAGRVGFALFALALFTGMFTKATSAAAFVGTTSLSARQSIALDYSGHYALETLLSRVLGGIGLTIFLMAVSLRMVRTRVFPIWFAVMGILVAALLATTALLFALAPSQATTPTAGLTMVALALWLAVVGVFLARLRVIPTQTPVSATP